MKFHQLNSNLFKVLIGFVLSMIVIPMSGIQASESTSAVAQTENVRIFFNPSNVTLPPDTTLNLMMDAHSDQIVFVRIDLAFNPSKIQLSGEIQQTDLLRTKIQTTSRATANSTGQITIILGLAPSDPAPTGIFEVAQIPIHSVTNTTQNTNISFVAQDIEIVDKNAIDLASVGEPAEIALIAGTFADVPSTHPFYGYIEAFYNAGITTGCNTNPMKFCPLANVTRAEMAIFIERAMDNFNPNPSPTGMFADVPGDHWAAKFIDEFYNDGITTGCATNPLRYCPNNNVTRQEMAVFIERALGNFAPTPDPTGMFADVPYPGMPVTFPAFIEQFYNDGITTGCANNPLRYCPLNKVTRQEMAVFIVRAFDIPLP